MSLKKLNITLLGVVGMSIFATGTALAHTAYLKPNTFSTMRGNTITLESSFTESFSNPEVVVKSKNWHFYTPKGERKNFDMVQSHKQVTILEQAIEDNGTYRFTSGERLGRKGEMYKLKDGSLQSMFGHDRKKKPQPEGAVTITTQTATIADTYVTKGAPTLAVLQTRIGRLAIIPVTHPNEIYAEDGFAFRLTFDGKAMKNQSMTLYRDGGMYADDKGVVKLKTGKKSVTKIDFKQPGMYLLMTRHKADAPEGSETDLRSYTTSLTFEVTP
ncbi:MAG: nickel uptake transporter family protein [Robiginitomaculum sp.]|nr:MAG: nickel uptake transporter family protein [Robiginitomaculum sp.]